MNKNEQYFKLAKNIMFWTLPSINMEAETFGKSKYLRRR